ARRTKNKKDVPDENRENIGPMGKNESEQGNVKRSKNLRGSDATPSRRTRAAVATASEEKAKSLILFTPTQGELSASEGYSSQEEDEEETKNEGEVELDSR
ncbi:hypothetical protein PENTCL1PPCAC_10071, partial [Pristionchus entomophagus]